MNPPHPANEKTRLEVLWHYEVLDTAPEETYDELARLAAHICEAPLALISFVAEQREWFKSRAGLTRTELDREVSFCGWTILQTDLMIVPDTLADERFADNPLVTAEPRIRFYAGAPLLTPEGQALGALCIIDHRPRQLSEEQQQALRVLSRHVMTQLELRRRTRELMRARQERERAEAAQRQALDELQRRARRRAEAMERDRQASPSSMAGRQFPLKIAIGYTVLGALWILLSDWLLVALIREQEAVNDLQTVKGWCFVLITGLALWRGLEWYLTRMRAAESRLKDSEERFRLLVAGVRDYAIFQLDPQGCVVSWNVGAQRINGYQETEVIGRHYSCFFPPEDAEQGRPAEILRLATTQGRFEEEAWRLRKSGKRFWASVAITPLYDAAGTLRGFAKVTRDITERKQVEEELQRSNRALRAITGCTQALLRATCEDDLLREICRVIVRQCGYRLAWVGLVEHDEAKTVRPVAQAGYEAGYLETVRLTWADTERGRGPVGMAIRLQEHFVVQNILAEPFFAPWRAEAMQRGYASVIALPLLSKGRIWGVLAIYAAEPDAFDGPEVSLLNELAADLMFGIDALRHQADPGGVDPAPVSSEDEIRPAPLS